MLLFFIFLAYTVAFNATFCQSEEREKKVNEKIINCEPHLIDKFRKNILLNGKWVWDTGFCRFKDVATVVIVYILLDFITASGGSSILLLHNFKNNTLTRSDHAQKGNDMAVDRHLLRSCDAVYYSLGEFV